MYEDHFGLAARPFQLTPDARFWFETATHRKAMAYLGYGLAQGEGFIVVTGDVGAGKTTLVGHLMERIDGGRINPIRIVSTQVEADDLLRIVADGLALDPAGRSKAELLVLIERGLHAVARTGKRTLLIVDEAQALATSALEELRMLSNFQAGGRALIQIFLLGQPEFRDRLTGSEALEQLRQRVIATHHLDPMGPEEVEPYVAHRLAVAGWQGRPDFADDAFPALYVGSGGVPRRLNLLAGRVLLHCAVEGIELVDAGVVAAVAADGAAELGARPEARVAKPEPLAATPSIGTPIAAPLVEPAAMVPVLEPAPPAPAPDETPAAADIAAPATVEASGEVAPPVTARPPRPYLVPDAPRPIASVLPAAAPRPIRLAEPLAPAPEAIASPDPVEPALTPDPTSEDDRFAALEARLEAQDAALRRVLTLLVDWVEADPGATYSQPAPGRAAA